MALANETQRKESAKSRIQEEHEKDRKDEKCVKAS